MCEYFLVSQMNGYLLTTTAAKELGVLMIHQYDPKLSTQRWYYTSEGYLQLVGTELVLDIDQQNTKPGAFVVLWQKRNRNNQKWNFTPEGYIQSHLNQLVLDIDQSSQKNGTAVIMWQPGDKSNQKFDLVPCTQYQPDIDHQFNSTQQGTQTTQQAPVDVYPSVQDVQVSQMVHSVISLVALKSFICPLTGKCMQEPVVLIDSGHSYEKEAICKYMNDHDKDPVSGAQLQTKKWVPNFTLQLAIAEYLNKTLV